jgi:hypothetical protein
MSDRGVWIDRAVIGAIVLAAAAIAGAMFADYYAHPDALWRDVYHDRNGHLAAGMTFAVAIKTADLGRFFQQLLAMTVWGPLHALTLAVVFLVGGVDHRLAILPSLAGWTTTVVVSALIARRLFALRSLGLFAAGVTAVFIMASPAFRLLGSDVMLEGLGAGLSAVALWTYLAARAEAKDPRKWRLLALVLTALFFEKANYWGLVAGSLIVAAAMDRPGDLFAAVKAASRPARLWQAAGRLVRDPLLIGFILLLAAIGYICWRGPTQVLLFGHRVSLYPPANLTTLAYALLFVRALIAWRRSAGAIDKLIGTPGRAILYWHLAPIAVSFLIPKRLAGFLWFVGPANNSPTAGGYHPLEGAALYWGAFADGFSVAPWAAILAVGLAALGAVRLRRYPSGASAVFIFALLSALGVVAHPQHQGRFLASWIFSVWICAGAGAAVALDLIAPRRPSWSRGVAAAALLTLLAAAQISQRPSPLAYDHAIRARSGPSDLELARPYLPALAGAKRVGFAATFGTSDLFTWTLLERCQCKVEIEHAWVSPVGSREDVRQAMLNQIAASSADHWVVVDAPGSAYSLPVVGFSYDRMAGQVDAMRSQSRYRPTAVFPIPTHGAVATVYQLR